MSTVTFKPSVAADNGTWISNATFSAGAQIAFGRDTLIYHLFARFTGVTIPQGALVKSAKITFDAHSDQSGTTCNATISAVDADNPAAPTTYSACESLTLTTASVAWDNVEAYTTDADYETPDITTVIQEIVDRAGWASGNALIVVIKNNASDDGAIRWVHSIAESSAVCPVLTVEYLGVTAQPITVTSALSAYSVETPDSLGYAYEEADTGVVMDVDVKTGEVVGKNVFQQKQLKYIYYDINTHGKDVTLTVYVDGVAQTDKVITLNETTRKSGRYEDIPDTWAGYRFSIEISADDITDDDLEIYAPFGIQFVPFGA